MHQPYCCASKARRVASPDDLVSGQWRIRRTVGWENQTEVKESDTEIKAGGRLLVRVALLICESVRNNLPNLEEKKNLRQKASSQGARQDLEIRASAHAWPHLLR